MSLFDYRRAVRLQEALSRRVLEEAASFPGLDPSRVRLVAGVDAAYGGGVQAGCAVLVDYASSTQLAYTCHVREPPIPYVPGLLAFREAPVYIKALRKLPENPDIILVDGHGLTHPRALGIATHIGLVLGKPTIGVAKNPLYGEEKTVNGRRLITAHGVTAGEILEPVKGVKLYVSIGYLIRLEDAVTVVKHLMKPGLKLPLPLHLADKYSKNTARQGYIASKKK
ncbi:endonuclease V [Desulfurococcus mucosus]|uniref:Endonuclease V n=1 Tax=Desulfurococcus mucosus (strain ATCC 35584 / DSM 2162 / JCM 9187 / O7/1) TaxID=765177 RepID=E8R9Z6_DESM0|nr:endonuclease V [Desulfurococcus mucosus]ADV65322.1 Endonuclease V [Desulfurococcus mucosus DSM 2162]